MKRQKKRLIILSLVLLAFLWNCSSHSKVKDKIKTEPPPPPPQPVEVKAEPEQKKPVELPKPVLLLEMEQKEEASGESLTQKKNEASEKEDPSVVLEDALNSYQEAQSAWERGDRDAALLALDEAYSLILKVKLAQDSPLLQEKNDLRLLIARQIQQVYASRLATIGDNHKTIPLEENKWVSQEIESFQNKERRPFEEACQRSGLYRQMIREELKKEGLPEELSWLPLIESGFKVRALSRARALGLWQFISSTGYRFGLKRDRYLDERMDPVKATQAAIKYLNDLHTYFGDWTTALAAYNCGEIRVQYVINTQVHNYLDNFWDLFERLPFETARFVPRFIAALLIINNPEKYGFNLPAPFPPLQYETVIVNDPVKLTVLATSLKVDPEELTLLNPQLRHDSTPNYEYALRVPLGCTENVQFVIGSLPRWIPPQETYTWHIVQSGETLSIIAQRHGTSVAAIARLNGLKSTRMIWPGQHLKIPGRARNAAIAPEGQTGNSEGKTSYTVQKGDTLFNIARKFGMTLEEFVKLNQIASDTPIYPGQELWVTSKK